MNIHEYSPRTEKISGSEEARLPHYRPFDDQFKLSPSPGLPSTEADHSAILTPSSITTALPTIPEYEATTSTEPLIQNGLPPITTQQVLEASSALAPSGTPALKQPASIAENTASVNPALLLTNYDKRKSSPAVLGLPLDMQNEDDQLSLHLSEPRNSIEAAMLLANFNRLEKSGSQSKGTRAWQDDMSIASQTRNKNTWLTDENGIPTGENEVLRRHSYDVNMSWNSMPSSFLARSDLLPNLAASSAQQQQPPPAPAVEATASKLSWTHDGSLLASTPSDSQHGYTQMYEFTQHPMSGRPAPDAYPAGLFSPVAYYGSPQQQRQQYHGPVYDQYRQGTGMKRKQPDVTTPYMAQYSPHPHQQPLPPPPPPALPMQPDLFYNSPQIGGVHTSPAATTLQEQTPRQSPARSTKRRRNKAEEDEEDVVEPGDPEFPDMSLADLEAAKKNPEARPRKQKLRFPDDQYTPRWVRYNGQAKEGLCDTCKPGKWLQLKNSAYWYHKQFFHGISSVSGKEFIQPLEKRWINEDVMEGLCHQCGQWVAVTNNKRKNSVLWYRHAHKCHVYNKPKGDSSSRKR